MNRRSFTCTIGGALARGIPGAAQSSTTDVPIWLNERTNCNYRSAAIFSDDGGETWSAGKTLYAGPAADSDLAVAKEGSILCLHESGAQHHAERIRLLRFDLDWLTVDTE